MREAPPRLTPQQEEPSIYDDDPTVRRTKESSSVEPSRAGSRPRKTQETRKSRLPIPASVHSSHEAPPNPVRRLEDPPGTNNIPTWQ